MSLSPIDLLKLTYLSLRSNLLRSSLTCVGVFMGVAAVSATLQVGTISRAVVAKQLAEREAPQIRLYPKWKQGFEYRSLTWEDMKFFRKRLIGWQAIGGFWYTERKAEFQDKQAQTMVLAVSQYFLDISGRSLIAGKFFRPSDFDNYRPVVIIDEILAEKLFSGQDPIGQRIFINKRPFFIRAVVENRMTFSWNQEGTLLMPYTLFKALTGVNRIDYVVIRPHPDQEMDKLGEQAVKLIERRFPGSKFQFTTNIRDIQKQQETLDMISRSLLAVGAIALLVGGVGIANITIATVMERTSEIGLRRAIGATQADIMLQFILEAAFLSLIGGILAIGTVHGITIIVADTFELPYEFDPPTAGLALGSALLVGVGAGFFPALQASQLDPVKALRSG
jgi:putative ABC transport system permease protein